ncbi:MAG: redox-sensing transcriptional repressor Rex [Trueperaceae bacterium]|jgi:redox-sensing transcriptional repressor|nr:redox-sensing transcriptional repressor Rex [Truepera sp.]HRN19356.1 redox-sensing transcriptional repressor Rex [Trueperaceae bacterium]HRQ10713.1 redox-sensing transcriptional repressor Rex [Trueperaceae bacterium]
MHKDLPSVTVSRLVAYLRVLTDMEAEGVIYATSERLGNAAHVSAHQVRKDLLLAKVTSGTRGRGYTVAILRRELSSTLGLTRSWRVAIVGMGRLGQALADYPHFSGFNFDLVCGFDRDPAKVGSRIGTLPVYGMDELAGRVRELTLDIVFLTVPVGSAKAATEMIVEAGVRGVLNFVPTVLDVPDSVRVESVDFLAGLKRLAFYLQPHQDLVATAG